MFCVWCLCYVSIKLKFYVWKGLVIILIELVIDWCFCFVLKKEEKEKVMREKNMFFDNISVKIEECWYSIFNFIVWIFVWFNVRGFWNIKLFSLGRKVFLKCNDIWFFYFFDGYDIYLKYCLWFLLIGKIW